MFVRGKRVTENLSVFVNGKEDAFLAGRWYEHAEQFFPAAISELFFFDGERIESLADPQKSATILRHALHSLFGLGLVDRLEEDLVVLIRRKNTEAAKLASASLATELEAKTLELKRRVADLTQECAGLKARLERAEAELVAARDRYAKLGGDLLESRDGLQNRRDGFVAKIAHVESELRDIGADALPLALIRGLLARVHEHAAQEQGTEQARRIQTVIAERDLNLLEMLRSAHESEELVAAVESYLEADRRSREATAERGTYLHLTERALVRLGDLLESELDEAAATAAELSSRREQLSSELGDIERQLTAVPDADAVESAFTALHAAEARLNERRACLSAANATLEAVQASLDRERSALARLADDYIRQQLGADSDQRVIIHGERVRQTLERFRRAVSEQQLDTIASRVLDAFDRLTHKESLVKAIAIDAADYEVSLTAGDGEPVYPDRLSAGERQLLAIALLWGLAVVSERALPVVVDTPLGRLDREHREKLVDLYFPEASHQVVLLSTDQELHSDLYERLEDHVGNAYYLDFDQSTGATTVREGYFVEA